jgi:hypothetical protein
MYYEYVYYYNCKKCKTTDNKITCGKSKQDVRDNREFICPNCESKVEIIKVEKIEINNDKIISQKEVALNGSP